MSMNLLTAAVTDIPDLSDVTFDPGSVHGIGWGCPLHDAIMSLADWYPLEVLGAINYIIPLGEMLAILTLWLIAVAIYYPTSVFLRWVKAIE